MLDLNIMNKEELLKLAKQYQLSVHKFMTKKKLITLLIPVLKLENDSKTLTKKSTIPNNIEQKRKKQIIHPIEYIKPIPYNNIIVLPQGAGKVFITWSHLEDESDTQAWHIFDKEGLDILLPVHTHSIFLDIPDNKTISLQINSIEKNGRERFFKEHSLEIPAYKKQTLDTYTQDNVSYNNSTSYTKSSSSSGFSSDNHFRR